MRDSSTRPCLAAHSRARLAIHFAVLHSAVQELRGRCLPHRKGLPASHAKARAHGRISFHPAKRIVARRRCREGDVSHSRPWLTLTIRLTPRCSTSLRSASTASHLPSNPPFPLSPPLRLYSRGTLNCCRVLLLSYRQIIHSRFESSDRLIGPRRSTTRSAPAYRRRHNHTQHPHNTTLTPHHPSLRLSLCR